LWQRPIERGVSPSTSRRLIASRCWCGRASDCGRILRHLTSRLRGPYRAFLDAAKFELRCNAKDRKNDLGKVRGRIEERFGE
jgi:hypothetical protein